MAATSAPLFTSSIVLGSALGVLPIAAISDRVDRRLVIAAVMIAGAACEVALSRVVGARRVAARLGFLVGLTTYSLYTLAVSLANDHGATHDLIFISVGLLFIYCVAAIAAPALASVLMKDFGPECSSSRTPTCTWPSRRSPFGDFWPILDEPVPSRRRGALTEPSLRGAQRRSNPGNEGCSTIPGLLRHSRPEGRRLSTPSGSQ